MMDHNFIQCFEIQHFESITAIKHFVKHSEAFVPVDRFHLTLAFQTSVCSLSRMYVSAPSHKNSIGF